MGLNYLWVWHLHIWRSSGNTSYKGIKISSCFCPSLIFFACKRCFCQKHLQNKPAYIVVPVGFGDWTMAQTCGNGPPQYVRSNPQVLVRWPSSLELPSPSCLDRSVLRDRTMLSGDVFNYKKISLSKILLLNRGAQGSLQIHIKKQ